MCWRQSEHGSLLSKSGRSITLDRLRPDVVLHLAWLPTGLPGYEHDPAHHEWATASADFASECNARRIRFLCAGSGVDSMSEEFTTHLDHSDYLASKRMLRDVFQAVAPASGMNTWLGIQYVFSVEKLRPRVLRALLQSSDPKGFRADNPHARHDFVHLDDVSSAISCLLTQPITGEVRIGSGFSISTQDFVEVVKFNSGFRVTRPDLNVMPSNAADSRIVRFGWFPIKTYEFFGLSISGS
jgi:nucleoside-diphosphate-sugar epimerase